jgi:Ca-activated chloride channel homolog
LPALLRTLLVAAALFSPTLAPAQASPRGHAPPPVPTIRVSPAEQPVEVTALDVRVVVHGLHAETTQTLTFFNPNGRVLEGELELPLPDGATVSGFALDVGGQLVDASVVEKHQARVALEAEIRRGIDPGLVEQVRGNAYRTRLYPIPARGTRTVRLRWISALTTRGGEAAYHLPLGWRHAPRDVALRVEVVRAPVKPVVSGGFGALELEDWQDRWVAEARWHDGPRGSDLLVRLPSLPTRLVRLEAGRGAEAYFSVSELVPTLQRAAAAPPRRLAIAWDASASRTAGQTERELAFLSRLLEAWPATAVDLVVFRDRPEPPRAFPAGDRPALLAALRGAVADGGTALGALDLSAGRRPHPDDALWLLCSDGLGTLGDDLPRLGGLPVWPVSGAGGADRPLLRQVAAATGGELLDLVSVAPEAALAALEGAGARLLHATVDGARGGAADLLVVPGADRTRAEVVGRLTGDEAELTLAYGRGAQVLERRTVRIRRQEGEPATPRPGPVAIAWAQARIEALEAQPERNGAVLLALGRTFGLVSSTTSLLVLETLAQHLEHDVEPAEGRAELRRDWLDRRAEGRQVKARDGQAWLEQVVQRWQRRVAWWRTERAVPQGWRWQEPERAKAAREEREAAPGAARHRAAPQALAARGEVLDSASGFVGGVLATPPSAAAPRRDEARGAPPDAPAQASIAVAPWDPQVPWLAPLRAAGPGAAYRAYLEQRAVHAGPAFYLDCAELLLRAGQRELGLRVLSNLAELRLDDPPLLRVLGWRLAQAGELDQAAQVFEKVLRLRPEEPQSRRDLALVLSDRAEALGRPADAARAVDLLYDVAMRRWDRFEEIELVALMELNRILARAGRAGWDEVARAPRVDQRLRALLDLDLRVSLSWDADLTDVDLHLLEPTGEQAFYGHAATFIGGLVSRDFTQGYGPEEYLVRRAVPGRYAVKVHYYGSGQQRLVGPATLTATVFTNWGRPDERREVMTIRLATPRDLEPVGEVTIGAR